MRGIRSYALRVAAAFLAVAAPCAVCACLRVVPQADRSALTVSFDPVVYAAAKGTAGGPYPGDSVFGVLACRYPEGVSPSGGTVVLDGVGVYPRTGCWLPEKPVLWPSGGERLAVLAYSPFGRADGLSFTEGVRFDCVDTAADQTELLYAGPMYGLLPTGDGVIDVSFRHALCRVDVSFRTNAYVRQGVRVEVLRAWLTDVVSEGSFVSLPSPSWTLLSEPRQREFFSGRTGAGLEPVVLPDSGTWIIPQELRTRAGVILELTAPDGGVSTVEAVTEPFRRTFSCGRRYTVALSYDIVDGALLLNQIIRENP